jgi:signal transduction histidine kinase/ligand-binding sensor domain-containing protein
MTSNLRKPAPDRLAQALSPYRTAIARCWRTFVLAAFATAVMAGPVFASGATSYTHKSWTTQDGLPGHRVRALAQDRNGYLWLGTERGLVRFDGLRFIAWDPGGGSAASRAGVLAICAAADGSLWVSFPGLAQVDRIQGDVVTTFGPNDGSINGSARVLFQDGEGQIWAGGRGGLSAFRDGRWRRVALDSGLEENTVSTLFEDQEGHLWVNSSAGIFRQQDQTDTFDKIEAPTSIAQGFMTDANGDILVLDRDLNVHSITRRGGGSSTYKVADQSLAGQGQPDRVFVDHRGYWWLAFRGKGLARVNPKDPGDSEIFSVANGLLASDVWAVAEDRDGSVWVGTERGLTQYSAGSVRNLLGSPQLPSPRVLTVDRDGSVWVGTDGGLLRWSGEEMTHYRSQHGLRNSAISAIHADQRGAIWIGTADGLSCYWEGTFQQLPLATALKDITALTTDRNGVLWIADREKGLYRWDGHKLHDVANPADSWFQQVSSFFVDKKGRVWIGLFSGTVAVYDGHRFNYHYGEKGPPRGAVVSILEDTDHLFMIVTTNGISWIRDGPLSTAPAPDTFPIARLTAVVEAANGDLWIGAEDRIIRIGHRDRESLKQHPSSLHYTVYDDSDGLLGEVSLFAVGFPKAALDRAGHPWLITTSGIAIVYPSSTPQYPQPDVTIDMLLVDGHQIQPTSVLRLPAAISRMQLDYSAVSLRAPKKLRFQHMLEGLDSTWVDNGANHRATYSELAPGHYRFRVRAHLDGTDWPERSAALEFDVPPAYYQTYWFATACLVTLGVLGWGAWQFRVKQIRNAFALVMGERTRMAREIHDTLLQSLAGLGLHLDNVSDALTQDYSPEALKVRLKAIRRQVEESVVDARRSIWNLRAPEQAHQEFSSALRELGRRITDASALRCSFTLHGPVSPVPARVQEHILRIVQEALNNAIRHSDATAIVIDACYTERAVKVRVSDNGRGFEVDRLTHSNGHWGITFMRERAHQIGATIDIMSSPSEGTTVECSVPLLKAE